jgi:hypothetical protein
VEEITTEVEEITSVEVEDDIADSIADDMISELEEESKTSLLRPIRATLSPVEKSKRETATLTPVRQLLQPIKKSRGSPPKSGKGESPTEAPKKSMATLTPIKTMKPVKTGIKKMRPSEDEDN